MGKEYEKLTALQVADQVVAGTNIWVKFESETGEFVLAKFFESLPDEEGFT